jgi:hypothetical protein
MAGVCCTFDTGSPTCLVGGEEIGHDCSCGTYRTGYVCAVQYSYKESKNSSSTSRSSPGLSEEPIWLLVVLAIATVLIGKYLYATRRERKKKHFQQILNRVHAKEEAKQAWLVKFRQKSNVKRLCVITKNELKKFHAELPPRVYSEIYLIVDNCVQNSEFDKLFHLYNLIINSDNKTILENLRNLKK